jgi:hypothetical protein
MIDIDAMLDRMERADAVERRTTERPPIARMSYTGYAAEPTGNLAAMVIAHRGAGGRFVVDVAREGIAIAEAAAVVLRYRARVAGAVVADDGDALADAIAGAVAELQKGQLQ